MSSWIVKPDILTLSHCCYIIIENCCIINLPKHWFYWEFFSNLVGHVCFGICEKVGLHLEINARKSPFVHAHLQTLDSRSQWRLYFGSAFPFLGYKMRNVANWSSWTLKSLQYHGTCLVGRPMPKLICRQYLQKDGTKAAWPPQLNIQQIIDLTW